MENRDYLMNQIDNLDVFFKKLFSKLHNVKENTTLPEVASVDELLVSVLGISIDDATELSDEEFLARLLKNKLTSSDLNQLINLLTDFAKICDKYPMGYSTDQFLNKASFLENYVAKNCNIVYFNNLKS